MTTETQFLAQCEQEALHRSGAIQPHGTLLVAEGDGLVTHAALNAEAILGKGPDEWLGQSIPNVLAGIAERLSTQPGSRRLGVLMPPEVRQPLQTSVIRSTDERLIFEFIPFCGEVDSHLPQQHRLMHKAPKDSGEMKATEIATTERIADLTGFPRTMYYRFREDGDGEVIAEVCRNGIYVSYLGLRYPASDIPQIARQLYLKNPWRMIPTAAAAPEAIVSTTGQVPDLTYSDLRSVSPIHQAYLANMGVTASVSFPIIDCNELVGLIAAHHNIPCVLPNAVLEHCAKEVKNHAAAVASYRLQQAVRSQDLIAQKIDQLKPLLGTLEKMAKHWDALAPLLLDAFHADGIHLHHAQLQLHWGACGGASSCSLIDEWLLMSTEMRVQHSDNIRQRIGRAVADDIAGVLGFQIATPAIGQAFIHLTRREHIHEVAWGGQPDKLVEQIPRALSIAPRRSFEKWIEKRLGYCRPWRNDEQLLALSLRAFLVRELRI